MSRRWIPTALIAVVCLLFVATPIHAGRIYWTRNFGDVVPHLEDIIAGVQTDGSDFLEHYERTDATLHDIAVDSSAAAAEYFQRLGFMEGDADILKNFQGGMMKLIEVFPV